MANYTIQSVSATLIIFDLFTGENGNAVDMFIVYKMPKLSDSDVTHVPQGSAYTYLDSNNKTFVMSHKEITDEKSSVGRTLNQVLFLFVVSV